MGEHEMNISKVRSKCAAGVAVLFLLADFVHSGTLSIHDDYIPPPRGIAGFIDSLPALVVLIVILFGWSGSVITRRIPLWPFALTFGGGGILLLEDASKWGMELTGWLMLGSVAGNVPHAVER